jgi:hypothetical protein
VPHQVRLFWVAAKRASTSGEEKLKLAAEVEKVKRRLTTNLALTP